MTLKFRYGFNHDGTPAPYLIRAAIQNAKTDEFLCIVNMDREACHKTQTSGRLHVYSCTDKITRCKGATSGDYLEVVEIFANCNWDSLLIKVRPLGKDGGVCHTDGIDGKKRPSCFFRQLYADEKI